MDTEPFGAPFCPSRVAPTHSAAAATVHGAGPCPPRPLTTPYPPHRHVALCAEEGDACERVGAYHGRAASALPLAPPPPPPRPIAEVEERHLTGAVAHTMKAHDTCSWTDPAPVPSAFVPPIVFSSCSSPVLTHGPWSSFQPPSTGTIPPNTRTEACGPGDATDNAARQSNVPCWGGLRAGHPPPSGVRKNCSVVSPPPSAIGAATATAHAVAPTRESLTCADPLASAEVLSMPRAAPHHAGGGGGGTSSAVAPPLPAPRSTRPPSVCGGEPDAAQAARNTTDPQATTLLDQYSAVLDLPLLPLRPSRYQRCLGGPGSFTTLFVKHLPSTVTTGMHLQPFVPSEGLVYITVKHVHGQNVGFVHYDTSEAALQARLWFYECVLRRTITSPSIACVVVLPTTAAARMLLSPMATMTTTSTDAPTLEADVETTTTDTNTNTTTNTNTNSNTNTTNSAAHTRSPSPCGGGARAGDRADLNTDSPSSLRPSSCPLYRTDTLHCVWSPVLLRGAALCEAIATLTAGAAVELRSRYPLPIPYTVAQQLAVEDSTRLAQLQSLMPVMSADWSNKTDKGRPRANALDPQPQDYGRVLPLCGLEPVPHSPPSHRRTAQGCDEETARTLLVRLWRDYSHLHCDGGGPCLAQPDIGAEARDEDKKEKAGEAWGPVLGETDLRGVRGFALVPGTSRAALPRSHGHCLCACRLLQSSVLERCEFVLVARIVRPHFFNTTFAGVTRFRAFLDPPFRGGCFVCFRSADQAIECLEWFRQQPHLNSIFDVQVARQETHR